MKVLEVEVKNFMAIKDVKIAPDGSLCRITGKNGQGKSSFITALRSLFGGAKFCPDVPIRKGSKSGTHVLARVDGDDEYPPLTLKRVWTENSDKFTIEAENGARFPKPQQMIERLIGGPSFDPLAFTRLSPKEQASQLRACVGIDTQKLDDERARTFEGRTDVNRDVKSLASQLAAIEIPESPAEIGDEIDLVQINDKRREADRIIESNRRKLEAVEILIAQRGIAAESVASLEKQLADALTRLSGFRERLVAAEKAAEGLVDPDTSAIDAELAVARQHNVHVRARMQQASLVKQAEKNKADVKGRLDAATAKAHKLSERLEEIDAEKSDLLAAAEFPVPGMTVEGEQVFIEGVPFSQASTAEQIRVGLAIATAMNPRLRVILTNDGSLLDEDSMQLVHEFADKHGMTVFMECVGAGKGGFEIVAGELAGSEEMVEASAS